MSVNFAVGCVIFWLICGWLALLGFKHGMIKVNRAFPSLGAPEAQWVEDGAWKQVGLDVWLMAFCCGPMAMFGFWAAALIYRPRSRS